MQRCDFASIMKIIRDDLLDGVFSNQIDLVGTLFSTCVEASTDGIFFDAGKVNKWLNGLVKLSPSICQFYSMSQHRQEQLAITLEDAIFPCLSDPAMAVEQVRELLVQDSSVSENRKQELLNRSSIGDAAFLSGVLVFGMSRPFVARDIRKPEKNQNSAKSSSVQDYIFDADVLRPCPSFCGRDVELEKLHAVLEQNGKIFLQGIPGIGKSEIAKAYAKGHKKEYTNILYLIYSGNLKRDIADLQFADDKESDSEDELFRRHHRFLRTLKEDTLLIIDNFNTTATQEELLPVVMKYRCRILFTTKSVFTEQNTITVEEISDRAVLYDLFAHFYKEADAHRETVEAIMETVHYHTLSIELAARLSQSGILTPAQILSKLVEEKAAFNGADTIRIFKDGRTTRATYYQHIRTLFSLFQLDKKQGYAMECMSMMPLSGVPARLFAKWVGFTDMNTVNELEERGFIRKDDGNDISLHPMMQEVTIADLVPSVASCQTMIVNIGNFCRQYGRELPHGRLIKQVVENTIQTMKKDDPNFYIRFLQQVYCSTYDPSRASDSLPIIVEIEWLLRDDAIGTPEDRAHLLEYQADMEHSAEKIIAKLKQALEMYPESTAENAADLYQLHAKIADFYRRKKRYDSALHHLKVAVDLSNRFPDHENENRRLVISYASLLNDTGQPEAAMKSLAPLEQELRDVMPNTFEHAAVLRKLAAITANCGNPEKGLSMLDECWSIYQFLCGDDEERLKHCAKILNEVRATILYVQKTPGQFVGGV